MHKFSPGTIPNPYQWKNPIKINIFFRKKSHIYMCLALKRLNSTVTCKNDSLCNCINVSVCQVIKKRHYFLCSFQCLLVTIHDLSSVLWLAEMGNLIDWFLSQPIISLVTWVFCYLYSAMMEANKRKLNVANNLQITLRKSGIYPYK